MPRRSEPRHVIRDSLTRARIWQPHAAACFPSRTRGRSRGRIYPEGPLPRYRSRKPSLQVVDSPDSMIQEGSEQ